jgi:saccharopine dehydrogenase-like NADP-dependent oxidoreductase
MLSELHLFDAKKTIPLDHASPAQILQLILEESWTLDEDDKDMIVMYHKFGYELHDKKLQIDANMVVIGENRTHTAMSKTVGLPVAIATILILNQKIKTPGIQIPISKEVYDPILKELRDYGISFKEYEVPYLGYNPDSVGN